MEQYYGDLIDNLEKLDDLMVSSIKQAERRRRMSEILGLIELNWEGLHEQFLRCVVVANEDAGKIDKLADRAQILWNRTASSPGTRRADMTEFRNELNGFVDKYLSDKFKTKSWTHNDKAQLDKVACRNGDAQEVYNEFMKTINSLREDADERGQPIEEAEISALRTRYMQEIWCEFVTTWKSQNSTQDRDGECDEVVMLHNAFLPNLFRPSLNASELQKLWKQFTSLKDKILSLLRTGTGGKQ